MLWGKFKRFAFWVNLAIIVKDFAKKTQGKQGENISFKKQR